MTDKKNRQTRPPSSAGSRPPLPKISGYVEVDAHYIFHPSTMWVRPYFTELGPKSPPPQKKAHFAMKQTNICRLSGDINEVVIGPSDNGFPGPVVALDGDASFAPERNVACRARSPALVNMVYASKSHAVSWTIPR